MSYDPNARIQVLLALNVALARVERLGTIDERPTYDYARTVCADYVRAHDIYMHEVQPVTNERTITGPTINEYRKQA